MNNKTKALLLALLTWTGVARSQTNSADSIADDTRSLLKDTMFVNKVFNRIRMDICTAGAKNKFGDNKNVVIISKKEECETPNMVGQIKCNGTYQCAVDDLSAQNTDTIPGQKFNVEYEFICQRGEHYYIKNARRVPTMPVQVIANNVKTY